MMRKVVRKPNTARFWKRLPLLVVVTSVAAIGVYYVIFVKAAGTTHWSFGGSSDVTRTQSGNTYKHGRQFRLSMVNPVPGNTYSVSWTIRVETLGGKTTDATVSPASGTTVLRANGYPDWHQIVPFTVSFTEGCYQVYMYFSSSTPNPNTISPQQGQGTNGSLELCHGNEDPGSGSPQPNPDGQDPGPGPGPGLGPGQGNDPGPGQGPSPSPTGGSGGGGGSTAKRQADKPNPLPKSVNRGITKQPKLEPSPFFDGKQYKRGSEADNYTIGTILSNTGSTIAKGWPFAIGAIAIAGTGFAVYWRVWRR